MSRPLFVIGMQRNGTGLCARIVRQSSEVYDGRFAPHDRWDIPGIAEIGGHAAETPFVDAMRTYFAEHGEKYACVKIALPLAVESYGFIRLVELFHDARFVLIARHYYDAWRSWTKLPYLQGLDLPDMPDTYRKWHGDMVQRFIEFERRHTGRAVLVTYERTVRGVESEFAKVWKMLNVEPPEGLQRLIRQPAHWSPEAEQCASQ